MFNLSVNLEYLFREAGDRLEDRVNAAADAGFDKVEMFMTAGRDIPSLAGVLRERGVEMRGVVNDPRTALVDPTTHEAFLGLFRKTVADARALGCSRVVVGSGLAVPTMKRPQQLEIVADAIRAALPIADEADITIMLEAVNTRHDHPGVLFSQTEDVLAVASMVDSPRVRLLYDLYHSIVEGEDPFEIFPRIVERVEHVQIADVPGRGEPGSGDVDWPKHLQMMKDAGYAGIVGVECVATKESTPEALSYIRDLVRSS